jgi:hypothetical protein
MSAARSGLFLDADVLAGAVTRLDRPHYSALQRRRLRSASPSGGHRLKPGFSLRPFVQPHTAPRCRLTPGLAY